MSGTRGGSGLWSPFPALFLPLQRRPHDRKAILRRGRPTRHACACSLSLLLIACTRTVEVKAETHETASLVEQQLSKEKVVETVQRGPETITTTVEEWERPAAEDRATADGTPKGDGLTEASTASGAKRSLPPRPVLVKRTITVDRRGPSIATKATEATASSSATQAIKLDSKTETTTKTRYGPPLWLLALLAAALALVVWLAFKFSLLGRIAAFFR